MGGHERQAVVMGARSPFGTGCPMEVGNNSAEMPRRMFLTLAGMLAFIVDPTFRTAG
jgi:hypothetical protein